MVGRNIAFGIVIGADGKVAIKEFTEVAKGAGRMGDEIDKSSKTAAEGLAEFGDILTGLNSVLEIAKTAWRAVETAMGLTVAKAIEQRAESDKQRKDLERLGIQVERIQGAIGDVLIPLILGIADAFGPTLDSMEQYLTQNRELVGSKTLEFLAETARILVSAVAVGTNLSAKAWFGWAQAINVVGSLTADFFSGYQQAMVQALEIMGLFQEALGGGVPQAINNQVQALKVSMSVLDNWSDNMDAAVVVAVQDMESLERAIDSFVVTVGQGLDKASVAAINRLRQAIKKVPPNIDEIRRAAEEARKALEELEAAGVDSAVAMAELADELLQVRFDKQLADLSKGILGIADDFDKAGDRGVKSFKGWEVGAKEAAKQFKETKDTIESLMTDAAATTKDVFNSAFTDIGSLQNETVTEIVVNEEGLLEEQDRIVKQHVKNWGDAFGDFFEMLGVQVLQAAADFAIAKGIEATAEEIAALFKIEAAAASGSAKAVEAHAGIPFVGIGIGLAAAAVIGAAILAFASFETGGVPKGLSGGTSGIAIVEGKERVLSERQNAGFERLVETIDRTETIRDTTGPATINVNISPMVAGERSALAADLETEVLPVIQSWIDDRRLDLSRGV